MPGVYWCLTNHQGRPCEFVAVGAGALTTLPAAIEGWAMAARSTRAATMSLVMAFSLGRGRMSGRSGSTEGRHEAVTRATADRRGAEAAEANRDPGGPDCSGGG